MSIPALHCLPSELLILTASYLPRLKDIQSFSRVSKHLRNVFSCRENISYVARLWRSQPRLPRQDTAQLEECVNLFSEFEHPALTGSYFLERFATLFVTKTIGSLKLIEQAADGTLKKQFTFA